MNHKKYISINVSEYPALSTRQKNAFTFYICLMIKYNNNIIKKATLSRLKQLTGLSKQSIQEYLKIGLNKGYFAWNNKDLVIVNQAEGKKHKRHVYRSLNFANTKLYIQNLLLNINVNQQKYNIKYKSYRDSNFSDCEINSLKELKSAKRKVQKLTGRKVNKSIMLSSRSISKSIGVCHTTANNVLKRLRNAQIIRYKHNLEFIALGSRKYFINLVHTYNENNDNFKKFVFYKGRIYIHNGLLLQYQLI